MIIFSRQNISWITQWEYLIWKAKCRQTCLPTTKYEIIKTRTNLRHTVASGSLNVKVLTINNIQNFKTKKMNSWSVCSKRPWLKNSTSILAPNICYQSNSTPESATMGKFLGVHEQQGGVHMLWKVHRNTTLWEFSRQFSRNNSCNRFLPPS